MADLKPCPFCGGKAEIYNPFYMLGQPGQAATYRGGVRCTKCRCESEATTPPDEAIAAWNRRAAPADTQGGGLAEDTREYVLRAMARNYTGGHSWDKLDAEACVAAADEIGNLRAVLARVAPSGEPIYQLRKADGSWIDQTEASYRYNLSYGHALRTVYAAPQPSEKQAEHQCECNACYSSRAVRGYTIPENCEQPAEEARGVDAVKALTRLIDAVENAHSDLFAQCASNPIRDAWGKEVSVAKLNEAAELALSLRAALAASRKGASV